MVTGRLPDEGPQRPAGPVTEVLGTLPLVDHHCHGVFSPVVDGAPAAPLQRPDLEAELNEGAGAGPGRSYLDSLLGLALRRWCPPVLDLEEHCSVEDYLTRRAELGTAEVSRRLLRAAGIATFVVDTGYSAGGLTSPADLAALAGPADGAVGAVAAVGAGPLAAGPVAAGPVAYEIVRLESLAEQVVAAGTTAEGFADAVRDELARRVATVGAAPVVGAKSIAAYRVGLRLPGPPPTPGEVTARAGRWLAEVDRTTPADRVVTGQGSGQGSGQGGLDGPAVAGQPSVRCADAVLSRFLVQTALESGLPVQFHCGYGDADLDLDAADPVHLTPLLRATEGLGVPVLLLHAYPFHRQAGYLAQVFTHVSTDLGLATHNTGARSAAVLAEALELVPFGDFLFSSDAFGLPELYLLGSVLFRRALGSFLDDGIAAGDWSAADGERVARLVADANARRVYGLPAVSGSGTGP